MESIQTETVHPDIIGICPSIRPVAIIGESAVMLTSRYYRAAENIAVKPGIYKFFSGLRDIGNFQPFIIWIAGNCHIFVFEKKLDTPRWIKLKLKSQETSFQLIAKKLIKKKIMQNFQSFLISSLENIFLFAI